MSCMSLQTKLTFCKYWKLHGAILLEIKTTHGWLHYLGKGMGSPIGTKSLSIFEYANCKSMRLWQVGSLRRQVAFFTSYFRKPSSGLRVRTPVTVVRSKSGAYASLLVNKIPPFPWTFALILYPFSCENMENLHLNNHPFFSMPKKTIVVRWDCTTDAVLARKLIVISMTSHQPR